MLACASVSLVFLLVGLGVLYVLRKFIKSDVKSEKEEK